MTHYIVRGIKKAHNYINWKKYVITCRYHETAPSPPWRSMVNLSLPTRTYHSWRKSSTLGLGGGRVNIKDLRSISRPGTMGKWHHFLELSVHHRPGAWWWDPTMYVNVHCQLDMVGIHNILFLSNFTRHEVHTKTIRQFHMVVESFAIFGAI